MAVCYNDPVGKAVCQNWTPPPNSDWPDDPATLVDRNGRVQDPNPKRTFPGSSPIRTIVRPTQTGPCPAGTDFSPRKGRCVTLCEEFPGDASCKQPSATPTSRRTS